MRSSIFFLLSFTFLSRLPSGVHGKGELAITPPRGWNSYDSFSWAINEQAFLHNAEILASRLLPHGYEYAVLDYLWYRKNAQGGDLDPYGYDNVDEWGRVIPDPERWPSSRGGKGLTEVARKVHDMGLKFGIHLMRGVSTLAVKEGRPILDISKGGTFEEAGRKWSARDIGMENMTCAWMKHGFMSVNVDMAAGRAFLRSLYHQYAEWGVDFVKLDCIFGDDLDVKEITTVSKVLEELDRPVLFSISPGTSATPSLAEHISNYVNMYRITGDDWDKWEDVAAHFDVSRDFAVANKIGLEGFHGRSWPDLDMLPLGWLTDPGVRQGPHRKCNLTADEQKTQMTLWSMAKSPLMFGGDLRHIDESTFNLITHPSLLEINSYSTNNKEFPYVIGRNLGNTSGGYTRRLMSLDHMHIPKNIKVGFTSCNNEKAKGWFTAKYYQDLDQICWKNNTKSGDSSSYCLYKRNPHFTLDGEIPYEENYQGSFQLSTTMDMETCLGTILNRKRTASEIEQTSLSTCRWKANQMWGFSDNGTLMNNYSSLCAAVATGNAHVIPSGVRAWVATGRSGEIFLSIFNLNPVRTLAIARIKDLSMALDSSFLGKYSCNCTEVWSGKNFGVVRKEVSIEVETHGCALFILNCKG